MGWPGGKAEREPGCSHWEGVSEAGLQHGAKTPQVGNAKLAEPPSALLDQFSWLV